MPSILQFANQLFRTRNPLRDANTDALRMDNVRRAVSEAIAGATRERDGLRRRVDTHFAHASAVLDNAESYELRSASEESDIAESERQGAAGLRRIADLEIQLEHYQKLLATLDATKQSDAA